MAFTSIGFFYFVIGVMALSLTIGWRRRWIVLLIASLGFYATWKIPYLLVALAVTILASYLCAIGMEKNRDTDGQKAFFWLGTSLCLATLLLLRYTGFIAENLNAVSSLFGWRAELPTTHLFASIGVSYYVFQAISYLIDVRDGVVEAERNLGYHALYVSFFPKLLQGPIERAENLLPQLRALPAFDFQDLAVGMQLILWGLFQKVVVADRLALFVGTVYDDVHNYQGVPLLVATYFFAAQLYLDFAGYTDMALGLARLFGIRLSPNFNSPYLSMSVAEFWRRWHISFSSWLLEYLFRPLQLHLRDWRTWGTPIALLVTFLVSGLWHGASWCFVVWGLLHGIYLAASMLCQGGRKKLGKALGLTRSPLLKFLSVAGTFHLVCFAWIFFRAKTLSDAFYIARHLVAGLPSTLAQIAGGEGLESLLYLGQGRGPFAFAVWLLVFSLIMRMYIKRSIEMVESKDNNASGGLLWSAWGRAIAYATLFYSIVFLGTAAQSFIYQQF